MCWRFNMQCTNVLVHGGNHLIGQSAFDNFVVNICDISHVDNFVSADLQPTLYHIKRHHHAGMANVTQVIDGHATHVHAHVI